MKARQDSRTPGQAHLEHRAGRAVFCSATTVALILAVGACNSNLDPVGTRIGTSLGTVLGEVEDCTRGEASTLGYWQPRTSADAVDAGDFVYYPGASAGGYVEALAVVSPTAKIEFDEPGMAVLRCPIFLPYAGTYHVWVRAYAHNNTENSAHVGIDEVWPTTGRALQVCNLPGRFNRWIWTSSQFIDAGEDCRGPLAISVVATEPGAHTLMFSIREDRIKLDRWLLTLDDYLVPADGDIAPPR